MVAVHSHFSQNQTSKICQALRQRMLMEIKSHWSHLARTSYLLASDLAWIYPFQYCENFFFPVWEGRKKACKHHLCTSVPAKDWLCCCLLFSFMSCWWRLWLEAKGSMEDCPRWDHSHFLNDLLHFFPRWTRQWVDYWPWLANSLLLLLLLLLLKYYNTWGSQVITLSKDLASKSDNVFCCP